SKMPTASGVLQNSVVLGYADVAPWIGNVRFHPEDIYYHVNNPPVGAEGVFIRTPEAGLPGSFALVDNEFKMPIVWRSSLGVDYLIPNTPVTLTTDILYTHDINAVFQFGANRKSSGLTMNYAGDTREFYPNQGSYPYNPGTDAADPVGGNIATIL